MSCGPARPAPSPVERPASSGAAATQESTAAIRVAAADAANVAAVAAAEATTSSEPAEESWFELEIAGQVPAIVSMPGRAAEPVPVVVAAHGLGEEPKQWCEWCRKLVGRRPVVLCLRGSETGRTPSRAMTYAHTSARVTRQEAIEGLRALQARHPGRVDTRDAVFVGFSLGANTGAQVVLEESATFPRAVLIEGGNEIWDRKTSPRYRAAGGRRLLFACGTEGCRRWAEFSRRRLEKAGVAVKIAVGEGGGHSYREEHVGEALRSAFPWVIDDDPRWRK